MFTLTIQDNNGQVVTQVSFEQGSYILGRLDTCDIVLPSTSVSRQHARLSVQNSRCYVEDLGSANGVIVDGQRVVGKRDLGTASRIRLGDFNLFLEYQPPGLSDEQRVLQTVFIPRDSDHHKLVRVYDSFAGEEFSLSEAENTIGRTDENFILLSDPSISRHHAKIVRDGETYIVMDLQSSNGSSLNNKPLKNPTPLNENDIVTFGNVSFVFVSGDAQIDARRMQAPAKNDSGFVQMAGIAVLILLSLAIGGGIVFAIYKYKQSQTPTPKVIAPKAPVDPVKSRVATLDKEAKQAIARQNWAKAISLLEDLLALKPDNAEAKKLKAQSIKERDAAELLEDGEALIEKGKHEEAKLILQKVPKDTKAYERASSTLEHTNRTLAFNYLTEATELAKSKKKADWRKAHAKFIESIELSDKNQTAKDRLAKLEKKMKKKRVRFKPYQPK